MNAFISENDKKIFEEELGPRLPQRIFDAHVHIFDMSCYPKGKTFGPKDYRTWLNGEFSQATWQACMKEMLPGKEVYGNLFGNPEAEVNRDISPKPDNDHVFAMALLSPADSVEALQRRVETDRLVGFKPYLNFAADFYKKPKNDVEICDMLLPEQLAYADREGLAITLHIPRKDRFADPKNQRQMVEICQKYPHATFIFAHVGRAYFMKNIRESNVDELAKLPNAYFDTAMVNHIGVLSYLFDHFPAERVLFATDAPISCLHGKSVEINNDYAYLMADDVAIGTVLHDPARSYPFTTFYYEQLRAMLEAVPAGCLEKVLFENARGLFRFIAEKRHYI